VVGDLDSANGDYTIVIAGLPAGLTEWTYERYLIDDGICLQLERSEDLEIRGSVVVDEPLTAPQVHLIRLVAR